MQGDFAETGVLLCVGSCTAVYSTDERCIGGAGTDRPERQIEEVPKAVANGASAGQRRQQLFACGGSSGRRPSVSGLGTALGAGRCFPAGATRWRRCHRVAGANTATTD